MLVLLASCVLLPLSLIAAAAATAATAVPEPRVMPRWADEVRSAKRFTNAREGRIGWAVVNHRGFVVAGHRMHETFQSASVFKTMLAVCYLNSAGVRGRALTSSERSRLRAMVTRSDDPAANHIYGKVSQSCIHRLARASGVRNFRTSSFWGRTMITPYGTARMFFLLDRRVVLRHRAMAMAMFRGVVPSQRWGLARHFVVPDGMNVAFKGGFAGSTGGGRTVSQGAVFSFRNGHRLGMSVLTNHSPSQGYGEGTIEGIGSRLLRGYRPYPGVPGTPVLR